MTKQEIIKETAAFYNSGNRAFNPSIQDCSYLTDEGRMCAVGRCMTEPELFKKERGGVGILVMRHGKLDDFLKEEYRDHPDEFWSNLQFFHDAPENWNSKGLSKYGKKAKAALLRKWA